MYGKKSKNKTSSKGIMNAKMYFRYLGKKMQKKKTEHKKKISVFFIQKRKDIHKNRTRCHHHGGKIEYNNIIGTLANIMHFTWLHTVNKTNRKKGASVWRIVDPHIYIFDLQFVDLQMRE